MIGTLSTLQTTYGPIFIKTRSTVMVFTMLASLAVGVFNLRLGLDIFQDSGSLGTRAAVGAAFLGVGLFCLIRFRTVKLEIRTYSSETAAGGSANNVARWTQKRLLTNQTREVEFRPEEITGIRVAAPSMSPDAVYLQREGHGDLLLVHLRKGDTSSVKKAAMALRVPLTQESTDGGGDSKVLWAPFEI